MAEQYKSLHPTKYYRDYLSNDVRPDGRSFNSSRPIIINVGSIDQADGSAIVRIGNTTVVCGVKAEICRPKPDTPNLGFLVPNVELPPLCSSRFKPGPPCDDAQVLTQILADIVESSKIISLEDLCIFPDKIAWCLYVDMICLDYDGALTDACLLALVGSLNTIKLPLIEYDPVLDKQQVNLEEKKPLKVHCTPVATSFSIFDDKILLVDPTIEEESLGTGTVTVVTRGSELCYVQKPGGSALTNEQLMHCVEEGKKRTPIIRSLLQKALKA